MVYVRGDLDDLEVDDSDAEHGSDLEELQERVDTLSRTVDYLARRLLPTEYESDDSDADDDATGDVDEPPLPVEPDAVEDADLDDLREQVAGLTQTVEYLTTRELECLPSEEVVAEVAEAVVDELEECGVLARASFDDGNNRAGPVAVNGVETADRGFQ